MYAALAAGIGGAVLELVALALLAPLMSLALGQPVVLPDAMARMLDRFQLTADLSLLGGAFLGLLALRLVLLLVGQGLAARCSRRLMAQLGSRAFEAAMSRVPLPEVERRSIGWFISLAGDEAFRASTIVGMAMQGSITLLLGGFYFGAIVWFSPWLAAAVAAFMLATGAVLALVTVRMRRLGERQIEQARAAHSVFLDSLNGLRTVRALAAEPHVIEQYRARIFAYARTLERIDIAALVSKVVPAIVLVAVAAGCLFVLPGGAAAHDAAWLVTVLVLLLRFLPVAGQGAQLVLRLAADLRAATNVVEAAASLQGGAERSTTRSSGHVHRVALRHVAFRHPTGAEVFHDFSAEFEAGRSYALVGPSGSGKSTLFDLLLGLRSPDAGCIEIDGVVADAAALAALRTRIVLVGQQSIVFNESVVDNVRFGAQIDEAQLDRALRAAALDTVVGALPQGRDTILAYQGANLSGGQRQRIGLARALARDPDVLLVDEVTTGLDGATRDRIVADVLSHFHDRLVIWATHDPEVVSQLDVVVRVPDGVRAAVPEVSALAGRVEA
jgi:ABC-type bacteriocin/lantibiotic exporter with double-glycine peptidase domain